MSKKLKKKAVGVLVDSLPYIFALAATIAEHYWGK
jgi:hypothetical protein